MAKQYHFLRPQKARVIQEFIREVGLDRQDFARLLESSIERAYLAKSRVAYACCDWDAADELQVQVFAINGNKSYDVHVPLVPTAEELLGMLQNYYSSFQRFFQWWLCLGEVVKADPDESILLKLDNPETPLHQEYATMEWNRLADRDDPSTVRPGATLMVAVNRPRGLGLPAATRIDSIFLRLIIKRYFDINARTEIAAGVGLIALPRESDLGQFIGPGGDTVSKLTSLSGCRRIIVMREIRKSLPTEKRIEQAVKAVTGVKRARVYPPRDADDPWLVVVRPEHVMRVIGPKGANAILIKRLVDADVRCIARAT